MKEPDTERPHYVIISFPVLRCISPGHFVNFCATTEGVPTLVMAMPNANPEVRPEWINDFSVSGYQGYLKGTAYLFGPTAHNFDYGIEIIIKLLLRESTIVTKHEQFRWNFASLIEFPRTIV